MKRLLWIVWFLPGRGRAIAYYITVDVSAAPTQLTFDSVSRGDVVATVEATGTLQPVDTVEVGTQVSGTIATLGTDFNSWSSAARCSPRSTRRCSRRRSIRRKATVIRLQSDVEQRAGPARGRAAQAEARRTARRRSNCWRNRTSTPRDRPRASRETVADRREGAARRRRKPR